MLQSSLKPGLLFQRCSSAYVTRLPVMYRTVSSAERQYVPRTSTSTPSTSKIRICGRGNFFMVFRVSPGIAGFPSARKECTRKQEKNVKIRISRQPRGESSSRSELKVVQSVGKERKTASGCRTSILLVRHTRCGGG